MGGAAVSIADRLDTVCGCFGIGISPTGTADPYGLRRHALAVIAILMDRGWRVSLTTLGFLQFLAPTLQFLIGVYYGEPLTTARVVCFVCIWTAVLVFSYDALRSGRRKPLPAQPTEA